jgi:hypothetical protein
MNSGRVELRRGGYERWGGLTILVALYTACSRSRCAAWAAVSNGHASSFDGFNEILCRVHEALHVPRLIGSHPRTPVIRRPSRRARRHSVGTRAGRVITREIGLGGCPLTLFSKPHGVSCVKRPPRPQFRGVKEALGTCQPTSTTIESPSMSTLHVRTPCGGGGPRTAPVVTSN